MSRETGPSAREPQSASIFHGGEPKYLDEKQTIVDPASINAENLMKRFGLQVKDATQQVAFGKNKGSFALLLEGTGCPVGGKLEKAFKAEGMEGVISKLEFYEEEFDLVDDDGVGLLVGKISNETMELHQDPTKMAEWQENQKKNSRRQTQVYPPMNL